MWWWGSYEESGVPLCLAPSTTQQTQCRNARTQERRDAGTQERRDAGTQERSLHTALLRMRGMTTPPTPLTSPIPATSPTAPAQMVRAPEFEEGMGWREGGMWGREQEVKRER